MKKNSPAERPPMPMRVSRAAHREAKRLLEVASLHGWSALGVERTEPPTMAMIVEEALLQLGRSVRKP